MSRLDDDTLKETIRLLNDVDLLSAPRERLALALAAATDVCERLFAERSALERERDILVDALKFVAGRGKCEGSGSVYFVTIDDPGMVKIGFAKNVESRIKSLQTANHGKVRVIGKIPGTKSDESAMHRRFSRYRRRGEWFTVAGELADFIKTLETAPHLSDADHTRP